MGADGRPFYSCLVGKKKILYKKHEQNLEDICAPTYTGLLVWIFIDLVPNVHIFKS